MKDNGRILAFGAHPDDAEFMVSGTLALLRDKGYEITIATMSDGDCGSMELGNAAIAKVRRKEAEAAAAVLGARYTCAGEHDLAIDYDTATRRKATGVVRQADPFLVFTHSPIDYMVDHMVTAALVRDALFCAPMPNFKAGRTKSTTGGIPYLYFCDPLEGTDHFGNDIPPDFYVDITSKLDIKKEMLACHKSQRDWLLKQHGMDQYINTMVDWAAKRGREIGRKYAEGFRQHLGHAYPHDNVLKDLVGMVWTVGKRAGARVVRAKRAK